MFQFFPKIQYGFEGGTYEVTNIFKSVNLVFDRPGAILTTQAQPGERADQVSYRLYNDPQYYWSLFLVNGIKNPLRDWAQTQESYNSQIELEYDGWVYQFANISDFIPAAGSTGFTGDFLKGYTGTNLDNISAGDILIYETGTGPFSIKCYGAGGVTSEPSCGSPQYGQSIIPDTFNQQPNITQISNGNYFSSCLDSRGYIYAWGKDIGLAGIYLPSTDEYTGSFNKFGELYKSKTGNYSYIDASGDRIVAIRDGSMYCFGDECDDFTVAASGATGIVKTAWTSDLSGGVGIKENGTLVDFDTSAPAGVTFYDADCGAGFCVGILGANYGVTAWGSNTYQQLVVPAGVTGITMVSATYNHALAVHSNGTAYAWGATADGQLNIPTGTYTTVSAGRYHSAGINTNKQLVVWGNILKYGDAACAGQTLEKVIPLGLSGSFSQIDSGYDHIILRGTDTNKKYLGVVETVDSEYKRIFVKTYQFPDTLPVSFDDPSGTIVSVWRYDSDQNKYVQIKTIQNQLLDIQKYLDSTKYIQQAGQILNIGSDNNWQNTYITGYQQGNDNDEFITLRKELLDIDLYNKTQIKQLSQTGVNNLQTAVANLLKSNTDNKIKISEL